MGLEVWPKIASARTAATNEILGSFIPADYTRALKGRQGGQAGLGRQGGIS
jgi:hypothetical protein